MVDDTQGAPDDDSTYYSLASGSNTKQGVSFDTSGLNANAKIRHIAVTVRVRREATSGSGYTAYVYYGGTLYKLTASMSLTTSYADFTMPIFIPPGGSDWWSPATIDNLEVVIENISNVTPERVTQIYLTVTYDDPTAALEAGYGSNLTLTITNTSASQLDSGYSALTAFTGGDASAIFNGSLDAGNDVRITYDGTQLHRELEEFTAASVKIWFKTQANIAGSGTDTDYKLHYGKSGADTAPSGRTWIFSFPSQTADGEYIMETSGDVRAHILTKFYQGITTVDGDSYQAESSASYQPYAEIAASMRCLADDGDNWVGGTGPELMCDVRKVGTNTTYLWTRGYGVGAAGNSFFPRIDSSNGSYEDLPSNDWEWNKADITTATAGTRSVGTRAREDGVIFDSLILTENKGFSISSTDPYNAAISVFRPVQDSEPTISMGLILTGGLSFNSALLTYTGEASVAGVLSMSGRLTMQIQLGMVGALTLNGLLSVPGGNRHQILI
jgi:hypothetical protein